MSTSDFLFKDLNQRYKILKREFNHYSRIQRFFETDQVHSHSQMRQAISKLNFGLIKEEINHIGELINDIEEYKDDYHKFFRLFLGADNKIKNIMALIGFLETKISYILDCFPPYYPSPSISRSRQEYGCYQWLKIFLDDYCRFFDHKLFDAQSSSSEGDTYQDRVHVYWQFDQENIYLDHIFYLVEGERQKKKCIDKIPSLLLFKGSFFLVNMPSLWPLLTHEALHFLVARYKYCGVEINEKGVLSPPEFVRLVEKVKLICREAFKLMDLGKKGSFHFGSIFEDVCVDAVCCHLLGTAYFDALFRLLFLFDEGVDIRHLSNNTPYPLKEPVVNWGIRLLSLKDLVGPSRKKDFEFIEKCLEIRKDLCNPEYYNDFLFFEEAQKVIINIVRKGVAFLTERLDLFLYSYNIKGDHYRLKRLNSYRYYFNFLADNFRQKDLDELGEGRVLALSARQGFQSLSKDRFEKFSEKTVILLEYEKIRPDVFNDAANDIKIILENRHQTHDSGPKAYRFLVQGAFNFVNIFPSFHTCGNGPENGEDKVKYPYYTYEQAFSVLELINYKGQRIEECNTDDIREFLKEYSRGALIAVQIDIPQLHQRQDVKLTKLNKMDNLLSSFLMKKIMENNEYITSCLIAYSFGWAHYFVLFGVKGNAYEALKKIKITFSENDKITDDENEYEVSIQRTKTELFIGIPTLTEKVEFYVPNPSFLIRKGSALELDLHSNWKCYLRPGIYDLEIEIDAWKESIAAYEFWENYKQLLCTEHVTDLQCRPKISLN